MQLTWVGCRSSNRKESTLSNLAKFSRILAGGAVLALLCGPAVALDVGASVGGISAGASIGGRSGGGLGVGAGASVGGSGGVNAGAGTSIGGSSGVSAGVGASVGGTSGVNAGVGATVGGTSGVGVGVGVGIGSTTNPSNPSNPSNPGANNPGLSSVVASMSDRELVRTKKRCKHVMGSGLQLDADIAALCKLVMMASR